ncbi:TVP38/TMEM64 family protein [Bacillaceae bacterium SIJ1]|uniref:TVP38/TMEM64 family protein n=1 Tax=Litoribacterium kuwaitense TaxID=1398745 RepID=UPI0013E9BFD0|nr:TVP38/TMEM64 family protein [Litoribacterium kuwaitense]NGP45005.1 TVP38/TMEM64 family protein [Litoribacterium kuwaitense]
MQEWLDIASVWVAAAGIFAPLIFLGLHIIRPFLFIPVSVLCLLGGVLFGFWLGSFLSILGLWAVCEWFYWGVQKIPWLHRKINHLKESYGGQRKWTISQLVMLRLVPFMHFHFVSLLVMDYAKTRSAYRFYSLVTIVPTAFLYTIFGRSLTKLPPLVVLGSVLVLGGFILSARQKLTTLAWEEFFAMAEPSKSRAD